MGESEVWEKPEYAQSLGKERSKLETVVLSIDNLTAGITEVEDLLKLAQEESDQELHDEASTDLDALQSKLERLEFQRMFAGEMDAANAYLDIQAGSGGTEAQDWAEMLLRMYLRWSESKGFATELVLSLIHI